MSVVCLAVRLCTVMALRGNTLAGLRVEDSPQNPLADLTGVALAVYGGEWSMKPTGRDWLGASRTMDLSIHVHLPETVAVPTASGTITLAVRKSGAEPVFDLVWRQIARSLLVEDNVWSTLWRRFVNGNGDIASRPFLIEMDKGVRVQAREIMLTLSTINEPNFGPVPAGSPWADLLAAMRLEDTLAALADALEREIESPTSLLTWQTIKAALGLTVEEAQAIGVAEFLADGDPSIPVTGFTVAAEDGDDFIIDAATPPPGVLP